MAVMPSGGWMMVGLYLIIGLNQHSQFLVGASVGATSLWLLTCFCAYLRETEGTPSHHTPDLAALAREAAAKDAVVAAACAVVAADSYKHPMLSRDEAVKAGVMALHDAVNALRQGGRRDG